MDFPLVSSFHSLLTWGLAASSWELGLGRGGVRNGLGWRGKAKNGEERGKMRAGAAAVGARKQWRLGIDLSLIPYPELFPALRRPLNKPDSFPCGVFIPGGIGGICGMNGPQFL